MKPQDAWNAAYHQLQLQLDRANFDTWLREALFLRYEAGIYIVGVPNAYARDMLQHRLYNHIHRVLVDLSSEPLEDIRFVVHKPAPLPDPVVDDDDDMPLFKLLAQQKAPGNDETPLHTLTQHPARADLPDYELNPRFTFDRLIVNHSNQVAYQAALSITEHPAAVYNPFLVYGGVGLGKTHLLQAIAHACRARGLRAIYIPSEIFTNELIDAIRHRRTALFRERYRSADVLLVDDIQFIGGKESTQEEFFHTFNALVNFHKQIVLASDRHPRELATLEDRLRSRFQGGLVADVQAPELETRMAILRLWAQERGIQVTDDVIELVAQRAPNNARELEGVFNQIVAQTHLGGRPVSLPRAASTVDRYVKPRERLTPFEIIDIAAQQQGLTADDLIGKRRAARINRARQITMYLCRELTEYSLSQIGEAFGGRSHTTVLHGCKKMEEELADDPALVARIDHIAATIKQTAAR